MKKIVQKRLQLHKETLRLLDRSEYETVRAGVGAMEPACSHAVFCPTRRETCGASQGQNC